MAATAAEPQKKRMSLASVSKGKLNQPFRIVLYGLDGVGKTTFAANSPTPIFIGAEMGTAQLDVARFPQPERWDDVLEAIQELGTQEHEYKSLVIDTLDWLEPLAYKTVCKRQGVESIEDIPYGAGYKIAAELWHALFAYLERLQSKTGMHVILLAHSHIRPFKNPSGEDFDRYEMKLNAKIAGLVREWPDEVLFANYKVFTHEKKGRVRGISDGSRVVHTTRDAAFDAKNRHNLPDEIPLSWDDFATACASGSPASPADILAAIYELLAGADEKLVSKVRDAAKRSANNAPELARILDKLKTKLGNTSSQANDGDSK